MPQYLSTRPTWNFINWCGSNKTGKTSSAIELCNKLAEAGKKVLYIDFDNKGTSVYGPQKVPILIIDWEVSKPEENTIAVAQYIENINTQQGKLDLIVIDTIDTAFDHSKYSTEVMQASKLRKNGVSSIYELGYGKGEDLVMQTFKRLFDAVRGKTKKLITLSHLTSRFDDKTNKTVLNLSMRSKGRNFIKDTADAHPIFFSTENGIKVVHRLNTKTYEASLGSRGGAVEKFIQYTTPESYINAIYKDIMEE